MNMRNATVLTVTTTVLVSAGLAFGNWHETFDGDDFDLATWQFLAYPDVTGTFTQTIMPGADGNGYVAFEETSSVGVGGAAFGAAFGSDEVFADVRVGAVVNVAGDASHNYHGLLARGNYILTPGPPAPGVVANCYIMHINWEDGPANLTIDIEKVVMNSNIMDENLDVLVPRLDNARSYYAELDVVGSGPVYVTGSLYEHKGGPLVTRTATMVDTNANDWWEDPDEHDEVFTAGQSAIFAQNEQSEPAGFYTTFDDVSSVSDGPAAVAVYPVHGATDASILPTLTWVEAAFATGRQLSFGKAGQMQLVNPAPEGTTYAPGLLEPNQTYQWRVDEIGPSGTVTGHTWEFTTGRTAPIENFELYVADSDIASTWTHNIEGGFDYVFLETGTVQQGAKAMRFEYQNQYEPFATEATRTFAQPQDWTLVTPSKLCLAFRGKDDNLEQQLFVRIEDAAANEATIAHPHKYAPQSKPWRTWEIDVTEITAAGVDLAAVVSITIGLGDGAESGQPGDDRDTLYVDSICLRP